MSPSQDTIQRAKEFGNPVIQGNRATFIWEGKTAPHLISDLHGWEANPKSLKRLASTLTPASSKSIWSCILTLPRDAYLEYAFYDPVSQKRFTDPFNPKSVSNGLGSRNNFFYMPETMPSPFSMRRADVPIGALTNHRVETGFLREDGEREIFLYRPPVKEPVPLLVVFDGQEYLQRAKLNTIVDNLIADGRIQPIAMAFLTNGGRWRNVEYFCSDATLHWIEKIILPLARDQLNLLDPTQHPGAHGVLGASAGGILALYAGLRLPQYFGSVLTQSGVSAINGVDFSTVDLVCHHQARDIKIWMDVGSLDFLLEDNRRMNALLNEHGYNVVYREFSGGHNFTAWRDDVWHGLEAMFPVTG